MTITEEHIKASLISAVEDKLRRRIQERVNQHEDEMIALRRTKHDLNESRAKINEVITSLEREEVFHWIQQTKKKPWSSFIYNDLEIRIFPGFQNELKNNIGILEDKEKSLEKSLESLEKVETIDVDEAVTTTAPLYKQ